MERLGLACTFAILLVACSGNDGDGAHDLGANDAVVDAARDTTTSDTGASSDGASDAGADVLSDDGGDTVLDANDYCELTVDFFCAYYLRCGRVAAESIEACRTTFLETCNGVFEPRYVAYADAGMLELSESGMEQCEAHLESVACDRQLFDLDGGCSAMWRGLVPVGGACGPGIGSFVCDDESSCTLGFDLCGTCEEAVEVGDDCSGEGVTCRSGARCVEGTCVRRGLPGDACDDGRPCVLGANCVDGTCEGFTVVDVGDACGGERRCPYHSTCRDATCVESALVGEACADRGCASGWCDTMMCRPLLPQGETCASGTQCVSGMCDGTCQPLPGGCFE